MAQERDVVFKVTADTSGANSNIEGFSDKLTNSNREVQDTFNHLRASIKEAEANVSAISKKYGENSKQADDARKSLAQLNIEYSQLTNEVTDLGARFEDLYGDAMDVNKAIGEMEDRMYQLYITGQQNTQEFKDLQAETAKYRQAVIAVDKAVDQLAEQGKGLGLALQIGETVVAGYGVAQGAMALLGEESEKFQEVLLKLQAVQTVLAGLEQLKLNLSKQSLLVTKAQTVATTVMTKAQVLYTAATNGTNIAMKALRLSMLALPIVAIIAGIAALVSWMSQQKDETEELTKANEALGKSLQSNLKLYQETYSQMSSNDKQYFENRMALLKAQGASEQELMLARESMMDREQKYRELEIEKLSESLDAQRDLYQSYVKNRKLTQAREQEEIILENQARLDELKRQDEKYYVDVQILQLDYQKQVETDRKEAYQKQKEARQKRLAELAELEQQALERQQLIEDLYVKSIEDANVRRLAEIELQQERERAALIKKYGEDTELLKQLEITQEKELQDAINEIEQDARDKSIEAIEEEVKLRQEANQRIFANDIAYTQARLLQIESDFEEEQKLKAELALLERDQALLDTKLTEGEKLLIQEEYNQKLKDLATDRAEHEKQIADQIKGAMVTTYTMGITAVQSLSDAYFDTRISKAQKGSAEELKLEKQKFEINKKLQIAQAIMQGVQGVQAAFASGSAIPVVGAVAGPLFAALAGIAAAANVAKIKAQQFQGGGSATVSTPSVSAPSIPSAESIYEQDNEGTLTAGLTNNQSTVIIYQSDIEGAQNESNNTANISEWG